MTDKTIMCLRIFAGPQTYDIHNLGETFNFGVFLAEFRERGYWYDGLGLYLPYATVQAIMFMPAHVMKAASESMEHTQQ